MTSGGTCDELERLAVLLLEDVDLVPGGVEHDRAAGQLRERRQLFGLGVVGRHDLGDLRHHGNADGGQPEAGHDHDDDEAEEGLHVDVEGTRTSHPPSGSCRPDKFRRHAAGVPLRRPGVDRHQPVGVGRAGPPRRRSRLQHAHHARPLHRPAGAGAGADGAADATSELRVGGAGVRQRLQAPGRAGEGDGHDRRAVRRPPRDRHRRRVDALRLRSGGHPLRPAGRAHRPLRRRGSRIIKAIPVRRPRRRGRPALHRDGARRDAEAGAAARGRPS